jgi:phosphonate transport system substrate-binding protein
MLCLVLLVGVVVLAGCAREVEGPEPLRLGYTPAEDTRADRGDAARALAGYLQRELGRPVVVVRTSSYGPAVAALASGEIDMIGLGPYAFWLARRAGVAEAIAVAGRADTGPRTYQSLLVARRDSGVMQLEDLAAAAGRLRLNFSDPASNSGYLVPAARLAGLGLRAEDFASWEFTLSHPVAILNVVHGAADVAGVNGSVYARLRESERIDDRNLRVLWTSPPLPIGPVVARSRLDRALVDAVRAALVALPVKDPVAWRAAQAASVDPEAIYLPVAPGHYAELDALAAMLPEGEGAAEPGSRR